MDDKIARLVRLRGLPEDAIRDALADGVLHFSKYRGESAWLIQDEKAGSARKLDGKPWSSRGNAKVLDTPGSSGKRLEGHPVGMSVASTFGDIIICEGGPDLLAAYAIRCVSGWNFGVVCLLGSGVRIAEQTKGSFSGKRVRIVEQFDDPGKAFAETIVSDLALITSEVSIISLRDLLTADGQPAKDLCEVVAHRREIPTELLECFDFDSFPERVRNSGVLHKTTKEYRGVLRKTELMGGGEFKEEDTLTKQARNLASSGRGQSRESLFTLARIVYTYEKSKDVNSAVCRRIFDVWYDASKPNLDPNKTRAEYLASFLSKVKKVRMPLGSGNALQEAIESADRKPYPEIPDASDAPEAWRRLAAVCRELRDGAAGSDRTFYLSTRSAALIIGKNSAMEGSRALEALVNFGVIECVRRGDAGLKNGKASRFRYLL